VSRSAKVAWDIRVASDPKAESRKQKAEIRTYNAAGDVTTEYTEGTEGEKVDAGLADEQRDYLRMVYDGIENFKDAVGFLWSGVFRGHAHLEKHFSSSGLIERLEPVEQWFWVRDGMFGEWEYNRHANPGLLRGESIEPENVVVFETMALNRILSMLYL